MELIDQILSARNLTEACEEVTRNKGAGGVDRMSAKSLKPYLDENRGRLTADIHSGSYYPQPIRGKEIPKRNGRKRLLGIPTVVDRMLHQATARVLQNKYDFMFSSYSYGFRPHRNQHQAIGMALSHINAGYQHIVDIDLKGFFDEVDHSILLQILYRKVKCKVTLQLIRRWLRAPLLQDGKLTKRRKGVPQGGGALRKCPVDIFSDEPACRASKPAALQHPAQ